MYQDVVPFHLIAKVFLCGNPTYLLLELFSSSLLAETGGKCPLVFSVTRVGFT